MNVADVVPMPNRVRRLFDSLFSWYDPAREEASRARTDRTIQLAERIAEPRSVEAVREGYRAYADRLRR